MVARTIETGFIGKGPHKATGTRAYNIWRGMMYRCYATNENARRRFAAYNDVTVCAEWHCYQNFASWYNKQRNANMLDFDLDKDILGQNEKLYAPQYCALVPSIINKLLVIDRTRKSTDLPLGVIYYKRYGNYQAQLSVNGKRTNLGYYDSPAEAHAEYCAAKTALVRNLAIEHKGVLDKRVYRVLRRYTEIRV